MRTIARWLAAAGIAVTATTMAAAPASAGGGCHGPLTDASGVHVELNSLCFNPTVIRVPPGASVDWVNRDGIEHTVTATGDAFDQTLADGQTFTQVFRQGGTFPYYCRLHPGMVGVVIVGDGRVARQQAVPVPAVATRVDQSRPSHSSLWWPAVGLLILTAALALALWAWRRVNAATDIPQRMIR
jgi:plastocyanin